MTFHFGVLFIIICLRNNILPLGSSLSARLSQSQAEQKLCDWLSLCFTVHYKFSEPHFPHLKSEYRHLPLEWCENCVMMHAEVPLKNLVHSKNTASVGFLFFQS